MNIRLQVIEAAGIHDRLNREEAIMALILAEQESQRQRDIDAIQAVSDELSDCQPQYVGERIIAAIREQKP